MNPLTLLLSPTVAVHDHVWMMWMCEDHIVLDKKGQNHTPSTAALSHYTQRCLSNTVHTALKHTNLTITSAHGTICFLIKKGHLIMQDAFINYEPLNVNLNMYCSISESSITVFFLTACH